MTIKKAIEHLAIIEELMATDFGPQEGEALKLGIEALKRCKTLAENSPLWAAKPLPGETKE